MRDVKLGERFDHELSRALVEGVTHLGVQYARRVVREAVVECAGSPGGPVDELVNHDDVTGLILLAKRSAGCRNDHVGASQFFHRKQVGTVVHIGRHDRVPMFRCGGLLSFAVLQLFDSALPS
eukprot:m.70688 g.70688  ORF g.70688 m.70688 type:complete len:123 (+) comp10029_c0_seq1:443-811(+)